MHLSPSEELRMQDPLLFAGISLLTMAHEEHGTGQQGPWQCWSMAGLCDLKGLFQPQQFHDPTSSLLCAGLSPAAHSAEGPAQPCCTEMLPK